MNRRRREVRETAIVGTLARQPAILAPVHSYASARGGRQFCRRAERF